MLHRNLLPGLALLFCLCWATQAAAQEAHQAHQAIDVNTFNDAQKNHKTILKQLAATHKNSGIGALSVALIEDDKAVFIGGFGQYGNTNIQAVNGDSIVRIGSITKTFTALAYLHLVEQNKAQLNTPVSQLLPEIPLDNPYKDTPATMAMMLEHTSGLRDLSRKEFSHPVALTIPDAFALDPGTRQIFTRPGEHYNYTNAGAGYISAAIEKITQQNYDTWFLENILQAMGMNSSQLHWSDVIEKTRVRGYDSDLRTELPYWHTLFRAYGSLNSSAHDMSQLLRMLLNHGTLDGKQIFAADTLKRMETPHTSLAAQQGLTLGYGLGIRSVEHKEHVVFQHGGDADGYLSQIGYSHDSRRGYFFSINAYRHDIKNTIQEQLDDWLVESLELTAIASSANSTHKPNPKLKPKPNSSQPIQKKPSTKALSQYIGHYQSAVVRFAGQSPASIELKLINGKLHRSSKDKTRWFELIPTGNHSGNHSGNRTNNHSFRDRGQSLASSIFVEDHDGQLHLQAHYGTFKKL
ncbi:MAG: CubicO group peptidase (beta-lactamase class C family) [Flavobacteriales bacterium]|jgi:CubicO group peptidase (beta-lactamase class C family)